MDYKKIGFKAGIEIHQQIDSHKLFCKCQSKITEDKDYSFERFLRPTQSELGEVDRAALAEAKRKRYFLYTASNESTCLVEADEEPPHSANQEAIDLCLTIAALVDAKPVEEAHFMRKIVIDGSNTGGFQRTGLIATDGRIQDVGIQIIALEEDAARKIDERDKFVNYGLDRLGIPLIEIATDSDIKNPKHARKIAERIGLLLLATGKTKRGLGTIRQDLNVSVSNGARVEIKGIQSLSSISRVAENEAMRQIGLIKIKEILNNRIKKNDLNDLESVDVTFILKNYKSRIVERLLKQGLAKAIKLPGFNNLLKQQPARLGREFAVYARLASGIGNIIHSDEIPGYSIGIKVSKEIKKILKNGEDDAFVIAIGRVSVVDVAIQTVIKRALEALDTGVLEEVRRVLPDDTTEYMRPLPGAARMYPETDVRPVRITSNHLQKIRKNLPEKPEEKQKRFMKEYQLNAEQTKQILSSGYEKDFERLFKKFPRQKSIIIRTFLNTFPELEKEQVDLSAIKESLLINVFSALSKALYSKEAIPKILEYLSKNKDKSVHMAIKACGLGVVDKKDIEEIVKNVVSDRIEFVKQRKLGSIDPLMGVIMKKLRGKADGKIINEILKKEVNKFV